ncbi:putative Pentatricopeptide repeat-containing protein [Abeliophyllum distichum]|uniref:Pentatricopeptide repeat-containing protein n=1 Tax=Abeliophyllum distichum TaxID=126358 RepID=A0ABD1RJ46_9LAMI
MNLPLQPLRTKTRVLSSNLQQIQVITAIKWNIQLRELSKVGHHNLMPNTPVQRHPKPLHLSLHSQDSQFSKGLPLFREMRSRGVAFNVVTILELVPGCTVLTHLDLGMSLHCLTAKCGLNSDIAIAIAF